MADPGPERRFFLTDSQGVEVNRPNVPRPRTAEGVGFFCGFAAGLLNSTLLGSQSQHRSAHLDAQTSAIAITVSDGNLISRTRFDAFGKETSLLGARDQRVSHQGYWSEPELEVSGAQLSAARVYLPSLGIFPERDPVEVIAQDPKSFNPFLIGRSNPLRWPDPDGRCPVWMGATECQQLAADAIGVDPHSQEGSAAVDRLLVRGAKIEAAGYGALLSLATVGAATTAGLFGLGSGTDVAIQLNIDERSLSEIDIERALVSGGHAVGGGAIFGAGLAAENVIVSGETKSAVLALSAAGIYEGGELIGEGVATSDAGKVSLGVSSALMAAAAAMYSFKPRVIEENAELVDRTPRIADDDFRALNHPPRSALTKSEYDSLRKTTPTDELRGQVNPGTGSQVDPVYGYPVGRLQADHLEPMLEITRIPGFAYLPRSQQEAMLNYAENFIGLGGRTNASKGGKRIEEWKGHSKLGPVPPSVRAELTGKARQVREALRN